MKHTLDQQFIPFILGKKEKLALEPKCTSLNKNIKNKVSVGRFIANDNSKPHFVLVGELN
jgi:hypothetical protein